MLSLPCRWIVGSRARKFSIFSLRASNSSPRYNGHTFFFPSLRKVNDNGKSEKKSGSCPLLRYGVRVPIGV